MKITVAREIAVVHEPADPARSAEERLYVTTLPDGQPIVLNATAAEIFDTALEVLDSEVLVTALAQAHEVAPDVIRDDINSLLARLAELGILELT